MPLSRCTIYIQYFLESKSYCSNLAFSFIIFYWTVWYIPLFASFIFFYLRYFLNHFNVYHNLNTLILYVFLLNLIKYSKSFLANALSVIWLFYLRQCLGHFLKRLQHAFGTRQIYLLWVLSIINTQGKISALKYTCTKRRDVRVWCECMTC